MTSWSTLGKRSTQIKAGYNDNKTICYYCNGKKARLSESRHLKCSLSLIYEREHLVSDGGNKTMLICKTRQLKFILEIYICSLPFNATNFMHIVIAIIELLLHGWNMAASKWGINMLLFLTNTQ